MTEVLDTSPNLVELEDRPRESCGVVGIFAMEPSVPVAQLAYAALRELQHRGEEAAGVGVNLWGVAQRFIVQKGIGLIDQVLRDGGLALDGTVPQANIAVAQNRYGTVAGRGDGFEQAQPLAGVIMLAHNGNIRSFGNLLDEHQLEPEQLASDTTTLHGLLEADTLRLGSAEAAMHLVLPQLKGAFSLVVAEHDRLIGVRDPWGIRPLLLGRLQQGGYMLASETSALQAVGAEFMRELERGEMVTITHEGVRSSFLNNTGLVAPAFCIFEKVYFARPDGDLEGSAVHDDRIEMGRILAREHPVEADVVMGVPDSGSLAALGYSRESGIPFDFGFRKDPYSTRSFIQATQALRVSMIERKLSAIGSVVRGKRVIIVDDSVMRGNSTKVFVRKLFEAGAIEVHVRVSSPPNKHGCQLGIDTGDPTQLLAHRIEDIEEQRKEMGATSLGYISTKGLLDATNMHGRACMECMTGVDPTADRQPVLIGLPGVRRPNE